MSGRHCHRVQIALSMARLPGRTPTAGGTPEPIQAVPNAGLWGRAGNVVIQQPDAHQKAPGRNTIN